jgi:hypothetical protein
MNQIILAGKAKIALPAIFLKSFTGILFKGNVIDCRKFPSLLEPLLRMRTRDNQKKYDDKSNVDSSIYSRANIGQGANMLYKIRMEAGNLV